MRILFIGDVVGRSGGEAILTRLPRIISDWEVELTIVNGENADERGSGITEAIYNGLLVLEQMQSHWVIILGIDGKRFGLLNKHHVSSGRSTICRVPRGKALLLSRQSWAAGYKRAWSPVHGPHGRSLRPDRPRIENTPARARRRCDRGGLCEATGEKQAAGYFCDGRASLVAGTLRRTHPERRLIGSWLEERPS